MARETRPASVHLRMSPHLHEALRAAARTAFMETMQRESPDEWVALVKGYDAEDPGHFVEWHRLRDAAEPPRRRGGA